MTRTEQVIKVDIGGWVLSGIIDRMDPGPRIVDYKTGRVPMEQYQAKALLGMDCYALMCLEEFGEVPLSLELVYIAENVRIRRDPTPRQVEATRRKIMAVKSAVERCCEKDDFRASPGKLCDWCDCKPFCPAHGGDPGLVPVALSKT